MAHRRRKIIVLFGGRSGEHEVSLASATSVMSALDEEKYEIIPVGITRGGRWLTRGDPMRQLKAAAPDSMGSAPEETGPTALEVSQHPGPAIYELMPTMAEEGYFEDLPVIFPVLHGPFGEDGTLQGFLELANLPYVGAGVAASAVGMDKSLMKGIFVAASLPVVDWLLVLRRDWRSRPSDAIAAIEKEIGYPCFTKPANLGSSVGVTKCADRDGLVAGLDDAARYDRKIVVEWAVPQAREIECSVLGNDDPIASVLGEIIPCNEFYDYAAKYLDGQSELVIPAELPEVVAEKVRGMAVAAFKAIDCAGMARVDFLMRGDTDEVFLNELNTIPGFTDISMYPKLWEATGLPYPRLLDRLIDLAIDRFEDGRQSLTYYRAGE